MALGSQNDWNEGKGGKKGIEKQESKRNMTLDHRPAPEVLPFAVLDCK